MVNSARSEVSRPRIKEPVQKRSRETRRKILKVAMELFSEVGFNVTTTALIAQRGGFSVGSIYAHFTNKREIFLTVLDEYSEQIFSYLKASIDRIIAQENDMAEVIERFVFGLYKAHKLNGKLNWEMARFTLMDEEAGEIHAQWERKEDTELARLITAFRDETKIRDVEPAAIVIHRATQEVFQYLFKNRGKVDERAILSELATMLKEYVVK